LSYEPSIFLLVELFSLISLLLLQRDGNMGHSLEAMLQKELVIFFGVVQSTEENWSLNLILVLLE
jgi:hypothetical protein